MDVVNLPEQLAARVADAFHAEHPGLKATCVAGRASSPDWRVAFVYWDVPGLVPHPYAIYRIDLHSSSVRQLHGSEAEPHQIEGYL
jgi:hypothetical protein